MRGQGGRRLRLLLTAVSVGCFALGCAIGVRAAVEHAAALWRIADLFFDLALLALMLQRGPALLKQ